MKNRSSKHRNCIVGSCITASVFLSCYFAKIFLIGEKLMNKISNPDKLSKLSLILSLVALVLSLIALALITC
jgi:uncharacterized membrane protein YozB (DUF420 family)